MPIGEDFMAPQLQMQQLGNMQTQQQVQQLGLLQKAQEMREAQKMRGVLSTLASEEGSPSDVLEKAGKAALKGGMLDQAEKAFAQAGLYQQRAAHAVEYQAQADARKYAETQKRLSGLVNYLGMFEDSEAGWQAAKTSYVAQHPQLTPDEIGVLQIPWAPGRREAVRKGLMSVKDQMEAEHRAKQDELEERKLQGLEAYRERTAKNAEIRARAYAEQVAKQNKRGGKNGAHAAARPTALDRQDAEAVIQDYLDQNDMGKLPGSAFTQFGLEIASRARALAQEGTQWDDALEQALDENKSRLHDVDAPWYKPWADKSVEVDRKGGTKQEATGSIKPTAPSGPAAKPPGYDDLQPGDTYEWNGTVYRKGSGL